jgi:hypothetical protein
MRYSVRAARPQQGRSSANRRARGEVRISAMAAHLFTEEGAVLRAPSLVVALRTDADVVGGQRATALVHLPIP